jgi:two-component system response regulator HydG
VKPYLTVTKGLPLGTRYVVDVDAENLIGRGAECQVMLSDPLCSRVHAKVVKDEEGNWWLRDARSRNGTYIGDQRIDEVRLLDGAVFRVGATGLCFHCDAIAKQDLSTTQTLFRDSADVYETDGVGGVALAVADRQHDLLVLYQLSIRLLGCDTPEAVMSTSLDFLRDQTGASVAGFLWVDDQGGLKPHLFMPEEGGKKVLLGETITEMVLHQKKGVWIDQSEHEGASKESGDFEDAICVPLVDVQRECIGAIHLYRERENFRKEDFELAVSLSNILGVALARSRDYARMAAENTRLATQTAQSDELIGESAPMQDMKAKIRRVARAGGCVLIRGESGSGKELVARALHKASMRNDRPLLSVNCAALPHDLMESQLFGHKKGAFTGAEKDHMGWFQQADTGTLFLDEVGELTLEGQAKLLRILEGHPFLPVGATKEVSVDVRVIAATNRDLREFVQEKLFREDLYYRLSVFELYIPPLRDRGGDIELLVEHFLAHFKRLHGRPNLELSPDARSKLLGYQWPGNVRQLRNVLDSAVVMADGTTIEADDLGLRDASTGPLETLKIDHWEQKLIREALSRTENRVPEAAKLLGLGRATLYRKIEEYGIVRP